MTDIEKNKGGKAGKGLSLWKKATVFLSLMSWYTTEQGFQNTVFVGENPVWSMFASFAIQTILLAGVLYGAYILERFCRFQKVLCIVIWGLVALISIFFSYISISNSMYYVDFAVDGNQITEKFMRETVQSLEQNNLGKLEEIRPELIKSLKDKGYDVMNTDIYTKAKNYVNVTTDFQKPEKEQYLAAVEERYLTNQERKQFEKDKRLKITGDYVQSAYPETYKENVKNKEYWKKRVAETINSLNHEGYQQYDYLYRQEVEIVKTYNEFRKKISSDGSEFPTLDQMKALEDSCEKLLYNIEQAREAMKKYRIENELTADGSRRFSFNTANKYVDKACMVFTELSTSVISLQQTIKELIQHSYGLENKSVDEILALVGNSSADIDELQEAREQMLEAQGSIMKSKMGGNSSEKVVTEINNLMSDLNNYVDRAKYHYDISRFKKQYLTYTYNIVKDTADSQEKQTEDVLYENSVTPQVITGAAVEGEATKVISVTPELWTSNRKIHMSKLSAIIFDYPTSKDQSYEKQLEEFEEQTRYQEKTFLDTSDSEKAVGLLIGDGKYFPHKGKAVLAAVFAAFLDLGAAFVGVLIYLVKEKAK